MEAKEAKEAEEQPQELHVNLGYEWVGLKASRSVQVIDGLWFDVRTKELRLYLPAKSTTTPAASRLHGRRRQRRRRRRQRRRRRGRPPEAKGVPLPEAPAGGCSHPAARDFRWLVLVDVQQYRVVAQPVDLTTHDLWRVPPWKTAAAGAAAAAIAQH